jgi:benzoate/toluate 1,2-dioxygenase beta subunit
VPAPRTVHQVSNVLVLEDDGREARVASTLVMLEYRKERQRVWGGLVEHRLRRTDGGLRIAAKRVDLINSDSELDGIACLF